MAKETRPGLCRLTIEGMNCPGCAAKIEGAVQHLRGVEQVRVDYFARTLTLRGGAEVVGDVKRLVAKLGYRAQVVAESESALRQRGRRLSLAQRKELVAVVGAAVAVTAGGVGRWTGLPLPLTTTLILLGIALAGRPMLREGIRAAARLRLDMNFLMTAAVIGAAALGQWTEAGVIVVLYALSQLLEALSVERSRQATRALMELAPRTLFLIKNGIAAAARPEDVRRGDIVLVKPGGTLPVDGTVSAGVSTVNQSSITGESLPLDRVAGDAVLAGSINGAGALQVRADRIPGETLLDRVIQLVAEAQASRTPLQTSIERFARYYTPIVVLLAAMVAVVPPLFFEGVWSVWLYRALTLLMISCPCALVLATPVALISAMAAAARNGVLVKGGRFIEGLNRLPVVAFDKTGTITEGRPAVDRIHVLDGVPPREMLRLAATVESHSEHPIAQAIVKRATEDGVDIGSPQQFTAIPGRGASAVVEGRVVYVGSHALFEERGLCDERIHTALNEVEEAAGTAMLIGSDGAVLGLIGVADRLRPESVESIRALRREGVARVVLLSGDNLRTSEAVGREVGADEVLGGLLPGDKIAAVRQLRERFGGVMMVGDGINDAPALSAADVGIAISGTGADAALETADVVLMSGGIARVPWLYRLSRRVRGVIRANIALALGIKGLFLALAMTGRATLWMALLADTGVALLVVFNGLRMIKDK